MPTTRRFQCWRPATARPGQHGCGPMCATIAPRANRRPPPHGSPTRPIAKANIHSGISVTSTVFYRPTLTLVCDMKLIQRLFNMDPPWT